MKSNTVFKSLIVVKTEGTNVRHIFTNFTMLILSITSATDEGGNELNIYVQHSSVGQIAFS